MRTGLCLVMVRWAAPPRGIPETGWKLSAALRCRRSWVVMTCGVKTDATATRDRREHIPAAAAGRSTIRRAPCEACCRLLPGVAQHFGKGRRYRRQAWSRA